MKNQISISIKYLLAITLITGLIYPLFISLISVILFPHKASGSLIEEDGIVIGSKLIGQKFETDKYFWSRPSAIDYNPAPSSGTNLAPTSERLKQIFLKRKKDFAEKNFLKNPELIPNEMLFASASGVDPHISPASAMLQVERIAKARNFDRAKKEKIIGLINSLTESPQFGVWGNSVVNILLLNLALDKMN